MNAFKVVMLPYQMLLHRKTRNQLDINIKDSVVIIDEAHNLLDTIASIHSSEITANQLQCVHQQLNAYKAKYLDRFTTKNLLRLNQLISVANRFMKLLLKSSNEDILEQSSSQMEFTSKMVHTHELLDEVNISYENLFDIVEFCEATRLAQKVNGFSQRYAATDVIIKPLPKQQQPSHLSYLQELSQKLSHKNQNPQTKQNQKMAENKTVESEKLDEDPNRLGSSAVIRTFLSFLETLLEKSTDGRILLSKHQTTQSKSFIKYLLLNASEPFADLLNECRSIIVAGGTMQVNVKLTQILF